MVYCPKCLVSYKNSVEECPHCQMKTVPFSFGEDTDDNKTNETSAHEKPKSNNERTYERYHSNSDTLMRVSMSYMFDRTATGFEEFICICVPWFGILMSIALQNRSPTASRTCYKYSMISVGVNIILILVAAIIFLLCIS